MEQTEEKIISAKKYNTKIFPIYKMFAWDLLFYYSISFLFLTQAKHFTASTILFTDAFYPLFKLLFQIPCVKTIETIGKRKSLLLGNVFVAVSIAILLVSNTTFLLIMYNLVIAIGYTLKSLCESSLLSDCITDKEHPRTAFANVDGKGSSLWYYFDAITSISCGFLFVINSYLPMCLCLTMCIIGCILSYKFIPYEETNKKTIIEDEAGSFKEYFKNLNIAFKNIFRSNRLKALLLFSGTFAALLIVRTTIASSLFTEIGIKEEYFGVIFAFLTVLSGISSKRQNFFHKNLKNKVLTYFSLTFSISMIVIGITAIIFESSTFSYVIILICYALQYIIKGPYYTLQKRYLNSFSTPSMSTKIYSACNFVENIFNTFIYWISSLLLDFTSTKFAITILGCVFTVLFIFIIDYMKDKLGLKPEEYKPSDINFTEIH